MKRIQLSDNNLDQQHFIKAGESMRQFAAPLLKIGVEVFARVRIWLDGSFSLLTTHPSFSVLFVKEKFHEFAFAGRFDEYQAGIVLLDDVGVPSKEVNIIRQAFVEHAQLKLDMAIIERHETYTDLYWFGTSSKLVNTASFYLNKIASLKQYVEYFKFKASKFLEESSKQRLLYPSVCADNTFLTSAELHKVLKASQEEFSFFCNYQLSEKEVKCARLLKRGFSTVEIAEQCYNSPRTIEKQLISLRKKLGARNMLHLVVLLSRQ